MSLEKPDTDLVVVAGFGETGNHHRLSTSLQNKIAFRSSCVVAPVPFRYASRDPEKAIDITMQQMGALDSNDMIVVGHCYGALLALVAACRMRFCDVSKMFLIHGPLHPDVEVKPTLPILRLFSIHYKRRRDLAEECVDALSDLNVEGKIVTFGNTKDYIVPPASKKLPGDFQEIALQRSGGASGLENVDVSQGLHVLLPFEGHVLRGGRLDYVTDVICEILRKMDHAVGFEQQSILQDASSCV